MAKKTTAQVQFEADTSGFTQGIREADKSLSTLRNELKLNSAELKENGDSVDLLSQRQNILQREHEESAKKVEALESKLNAARSQFGDNSQEVYKLTNQLLRAKTEFQGIQNEITQTDTRMDRLEQSTEDLGNAIDDTGDGFTVMKGAMADLVSSGVQSLIGGVTDLVGSLFDLSEATEEYRQMQGKLAGSSETYGYSVDFVKSKYEDFYAYVGDDQMATNAITNLLGIATSTEQLSSIADGAIGVWATYGDSIPIESLTEAINETVNVGKVTGTFADTINWAGITNEQFASILGNGTEAQKAFNKAIANGETQEDAFSAALASTSDTTERAAIVSDYLNGVYGQSKVVYDDLSGSMIEANRAELELKDAQAQLGETMEPVNSAFTQFKADSLEKLQPIVEDVIGVLSEFKKWMDENKAVVEAVKVAVIILGGAFGALAIAMGIQSLIRGITTAFGTLNAVMAANPIMLIVMLIAGLVAGFIYLWNNCEEFREFWMNLWDGIKEVFGAVVDWIGQAIDNTISFFQDLWTGIQNVFNNIVNWISTAIDNIVGFFQGLWTGIQAVWDGIVLGIQTFIGLVVSIFDAAFQLITLPFRFIWENCKDIIMNVFNAIVGFISSVFNTIWNVISSVLNNIWNFIVSIFTTIWNFYVSIWTQILNIITTVLNAIWNVISTVLTTVWNFISTIFTTIWNTIVSIWNAISSAISTAINFIWNIISTVFNAVWGTITGIFNGIKNTIVGVWNGITTTVSNVINNIKNTISNVFNNVKNTVTNVWNGIMNAIKKPIEKARDLVKNAIDKIKGFFNFEFKWPKLKMPHFGIKPKGWQIGDLLEGKIPKLSIDWYADGGIFTKPTLFNTLSGIKGVGEAGSEAVLPLSRLENWIYNALRQNNAQMLSANNSNFEKLIEVAEMILVKDSNMYVDSRKVSEALSNSNDTVSGEIISMKERGLILS